MSTSAGRSTCAAPCRDGNCVSAQIERNVRLLADRRVPARERLMALAFLVHFMGDLHQPMHAGDHGDLGGNRCRSATASSPGGPICTRSGTAISPTAASRSPPGDAAGSCRELSAADRAAMRAGRRRRLGARKLGGEPRVRLRHAHRRSLRRRPPAERPVITEAITRRLIPIVRRQVARGGLRLARLLDEAFQPDSPWLQAAGAAVELDLPVLPGRTSLFRHHRHRAAVLGPGGFVRSRDRPGAPCPS